MKTEAKESTEVDADDIFDTPHLLLLQMKKSFLKEARDYEFWGKEGSKQRVTAMDTFAMYFMRSLQLATDSPWLRKDVLFDIKNSTHQHRLLPMPKKVRLKLADIFKEEEYPELQASRVLQELNDLRDKALAQHVKSEWSKLKAFEEVSSDLRYLRKCIYECGQKYDKENGTGAVELINVTMEYEAGVKNFVYNYRETLSSRETQIWKQKLKETTLFAIECLGYMPHGEKGTPEAGYPLFEDYTEEFDEEEYEKAKLEDGEALKDSSDASDVKVRSDEAKEVPTKNTVDSSCQVSLTCEEGSLQSSPVSEFFDGVRERKSLSDGGYEISEAILIANFPSVPQEELSDPIDLEIETRLEKIRSFRQALQSEVIHVTDTVVESTLVEIPSVKPKSKMVCVRDASSEAVYSSVEDTKNFNSWYNDMVNSKKASSKSKPEYESSISPPSSIPSGPEFPNPSAEKVGLVNNSCLATYQDKLRPSTAIIPNMTSLQDMVMIIVLTILNLLMKSNPRFYRVPAAFPMPTNSYQHLTAQTPSLSPSSQPMCEPSHPSCYCRVACTAVTRYKARVVGMAWSVILRWQRVKLSVGNVILLMSRAAAGVEQK